MSEEKPHDLYEFMRQLSDEMAAEYNRIQMRATEDPGTAGDQGEENWAELLRGWLPRTYEIVTKGRIISQDGHTSPQIDVLVLKSIYPERLLTKKLYLAAGVAAAFECKTTLKAAHIEQAVKTCADIKNLYPVREGTPYQELYAPVVYGLLAHSHSWKGDNSTPEDNIRQKLMESDRLYVSHPRECLDLLCVADLGTWKIMKFLASLALASPSNVSISSVLERDLTLQTAYMMATSTLKNQSEYFTPIGSCIFDLSQELAWEDTQLREISQYYTSTKMSGSSEGKPRLWDSFSFSKNVMQQLRNHHFTLENWNEWSLLFGINEVRYLDFNGVRYLDFKRT